MESPYAMDIYCNIRTLIYKSSKHMRTAWISPNILISGQLCSIFSCVLKCMTGQFLSDPFSESHHGESLLWSYVNNNAQISMLL